MMPCASVPGYAAGLPGGLATVIAAILAGSVAAISLLVNGATANRDRQRGLYGDAYRIPMKWVEMAYRAYHARRDDDTFLDGYHRLWEDVRYYQAWLWFESKELGHSYAKFTAAVQATCDAVIVEEWCKRTDEPKPLVWLPVEASLDTYQDELDLFLRDARDHLSFNPWLRFAMRRRVRARAKREEGVRISDFPAASKLVPETREHLAGSSFD